VFTHDHYGPSTHQQAGVYAGLLVEPAGSLWRDPITGLKLYDSKSCYDPGSDKYTDPPCKDGTYVRNDGGPQGWQASIETANTAESYREFALEFADLQLAYNANSIGEPKVPKKPMTSFVISSQDSINSLNAGKVDSAVAASLASAGIFLPADLSRLTAKPEANCPVISVASTWTITIPGTSDIGFVNQYCLAAPQGTPPKAGVSVSLLMPTMEPSWADNANAIAPKSVTAVSAGQAGTYSVNYRNEPLQLRLAGVVNNQPAQMDPSGVFASQSRLNANQNCQPTAFAPVGKPCTAAAKDGFRYPNPLIPPGPTAPRGVDPYTPLLRAYQGDRVQIRTLVGAHLSFHSFTIPGMKWLYEPGSTNTGYKNIQGMGLSEHYEMMFQLPYTTSSKLPSDSGTPGADSSQQATDYVYQTDSGVDGTVNGTWGLLRAYSGATVPQGGYTDLKSLPNNPLPNWKQPDPVCPKGLTPKVFEVVATSAKQIAPNKSIPYNDRGKISDPDGLLYVRKNDLDCSDASKGCQLKANAPVEPLILRANAGECIDIQLTNNFTPDLSGFKITGGINSSPFGNWTPTLGAANTGTSADKGVSAGFVPSLVLYDPNSADGAGYNAGFNQQSQTILPGAPTKTYRMFAGDSTGKPIEFGTVYLQPSDPLLQHYTGLVGALIIEPAGSTHVDDANTHAAATITKSDGSRFRELVLVGQNDVQNYNVPGCTGAFNYRCEPFNSTGGYRYPQQTTPSFDVSSTQPPRVAAAAAGRNRRGKGEVVTTAPPKTLQDYLAIVQRADSSLTLESLAAKGGRFTKERLQQHPEQLLTLLPAPLQQAVMRAATPSVAFGATALPLTAPSELIPMRYSNQLVQSPNEPSDPKTPILYAAAGVPLRFRFVFAGGTNQFVSAFNLHGHHWQAEPWISDSTVVGNNPQSENFGIEQTVANQVANFVVDRAGGKAMVTGDYLYEMFQANGAEVGMWGLLRVQDMSLVITSATRSTISGTVMARPGVALPTTVSVSGGASGGSAACTASVDGSTGNWSCIGKFDPKGRVIATTSLGASYEGAVRDEP